MPHNGEVREQAIHLASPHWVNYSRPSGMARVWGNPSDVEGLLAAAEAHDLSALARIGGRWALVLDLSDGLLLVQDPIRSLPLFIASPTAGTPAFVVTDRIAQARDLVGRGTLDATTREEFSDLGYVTGPRTLFREITQVQAGEWVRLGANGVRDSGFYRRLKYSGLDLSAENDLDARFTEGLETAFARMFEWVGDRQIVIPLSGGLDSRLLAIAMHDMGHSNVVNFTYGVGETSEVKISRTVAESLGQRWEFIQYTPEELRAAWQSREAGAFVRDSYAGASLPHIQDWFALREMRSRGLIEPDAVVLAGHTVVGNMHDEYIVDLPDAVGREKLFDLLVAHHAQRKPARRLSANRQFRADFYAYLDRIAYDDSPRSRLEALEYWNILERQTKYINNSMRGYEHFGYEWALPMLDVAVFEAWEDFALQPSKDREWYGRYIARRYAAATGGEIGTFAPTSISAPRREQLKAVLRKLGLLSFAERTATARAVAHHPMGFQAFSGQASDRELRREMMRGGSPMSVWIAQFLADTWTPDAHVFRGDSAG